MFCLFLIIGIIFGLFYSVYGEDIFIWNSSPNHQDEIDKKIKILRNRIPKAYKIEAYFHRFLGVVLGWLILWFLLDKRLNLFSKNSNFTNIGFADFVIFILGWVGINGRLPTIAHTIQNWFDPHSWFKK